MRQQCDRFGPKQEDHPSVGQVCPACKQPFKVGDYTTLIALGPGDDADSRERRNAGKPYNAVAVEVHWDCSIYPGREEDGDPD